MNVTPSLFGTYFGQYFGAYFGGSTLGVVPDAEFATLVPKNVLSATIAPRTDLNLQGTIVRRSV